MSKASEKQAERDEAIAKLREYLKPGDTVWTILRHRSAPGMSRSISAIIVTNGEPNDISWAVARATGRQFDRKHDGVKVGGCGMDMGFELVYTLSRILFPEGFAPSDVGIRPHDGKSVNVNIGRGREVGAMTNAEIEQLAAKGWKFPRGRNGDDSGWDNDGGYALQQRWL